MFVDRECVRVHEVADRDVPTFFQAIQKSIGKDIQVLGPPARPPARRNCCPPPYKDVCI